MQVILKFVDGVCSGYSKPLTWKWAVGAEGPAGYQIPPDLKHCAPWIPHLQDLL